MIYAVTSKEDTVFIHYVVPLVMLRLKVFQNKVLSH